MIGLAGGIFRLAGTVARSAGAGQPGAKKFVPTIAVYLPVLLAFLVWHYWLIILMTLPVAFAVLAVIGKGIRNSKSGSQAKADDALRAVMRQYAGKRPGAGR